MMHSSALVGFTTSAEIESAFSWFLILNAGGPSVCVSKEK